MTLPNFTEQDGLGDMQDIFNSPLGVAQRLESAEEGLAGELDKRRVQLKEMVLGVRSLLLSLVGFSLPVIAYGLQTLHSQKNILLVLGIVTLVLCIMLSLLYLLVEHTHDVNLTYQTILLGDSSLKKISSLKADLLGGHKTAQECIYGVSCVLSEMSSSTAELSKQAPMVNFAKYYHFRKSWPYKDWTVHVCAALFVLGTSLIALGVYLQPIMVTCSGK